MANTDDLITLDLDTVRKDWPDAVAAWDPEMGPIEQATFTLSGGLLEADALCEGRADHPHFWDPEDGYWDAQ